MDVSIAISVFCVGAYERGPEKTAPLWVKRTALVLIDLSDVASRSAFDQSVGGEYYMTWIVSFASEVLDSFRMIAASFLCASLIFRSAGSSDGVLKLVNAASYCVLLVSALRAFAAAPPLCGLCVSQSREFISWCSRGISHSCGRKHDD